ncbi:hypothetical protein [Hymenobacter persicinus]|uniref:Uncharacterized protein n=1 Tax=Hymenobacter persicinus TaxID=2025506 RepID=A0A4Q5LBK3_9BACT|nr:hypothetical protein [Hymenobacter persicinus]RYU78453.1 hypothetical protein EWM57_13690 [Hymenobacter persicinus]
MKTSNKLLLTALAVVLASLLTYNIALRAEYQRGTYKDRFRDYQTLALTDFDQVQVVSENVSVKLTPGPFAVRVSNNAAAKVNITRVGRRLVITEAPALRGTWAPGNQILISCPDLRLLRTAANSATVAGFTLDSLQVEQSRSSAVEMTNNQLGVFQATAGQGAGSNPQLSIDHSNRIQRASLAIKNRGELVLENVFIPQFSCQFSDSATARISGKSLGMMTR